MQGFPEDGKGKEMDSSLPHPDGIWPSRHLILDPVRPPCRILTHRTIINLYCFKSPRGAPGWLSKFMVRKK